MNKSNIQSKNKQKNVTVFVTISVMVAFALVASPLFQSGTKSFAETKNGFNCKIGDPTCGDVLIFYTPNDNTNRNYNNHLMSHDSGSSNGKVIEGGPIFIKGCKGGTAGEVPGKPGVCKEKSESSESLDAVEIQHDGKSSSDKEYDAELYWKTYNQISDALK